MPTETGAASLAAGTDAAGDAPRGGRRRFLAYAGGAMALSGGLGLLGGCGNDGTSNATPTPTPTPTPTTPEGQRDFDYLNLALNLAYAEANYYSWAAFGTVASLSLTSGVGTAGTVAGGAQVAFTDPLVGSYAREMSADAAAHVNQLQSLIGSSVGASAAQPAINIDGIAATGAFAQMAKAAGIAAADGTFNPYASDANFLLGAFFFVDVAVTLYKGLTPLLSNKTYIDQVAGILGTKGYHGGIVRSTLYRKGYSTTPSLLTSAQAISDLRDSLDGASDDDQGIGTAAVANITPADSSAVAFSRSPAQVLNVLYLSKAAVKAGGFFPAGVNGSIFLSAANS